MADCSKCRAAEPMKGQRYCRLCHNAYMRTWRKLDGPVVGEVFRDE
jgi:ribosomal protein L40E